MSGSSFVLFLPFPSPAGESPSPAGVTSWLSTAHRFRAKASCAGTSVALKAISCQPRAFFHGWHGGSIPPRARGGCSVPQFPRMEGSGGSGGEATTHPAQPGADGDEGGISTSSVPPIRGIWASAALSQPCQEAPSAAGLEREGRSISRTPNLPGIGVGGPCPAPPRPDGHAAARFGPRLTWLLIWD